MNLLSKLLLLVLINFKIIKSELDDNFCQCDKLNVKIIKSRIFNGRSANSKELKYVGSIYNRYFLGKNFTENENPYAYSSVCTGFLLNADHAITSGDCASHIKETRYEEFFFALAASFDHKIEKARKDFAYFRKIEEVFIHPDFNQETLDNNIGVVKFKSPFILSSTIQAACLTDIRFTLFLEKLYTAGYGFTNIEKIPSPINNQSFLYDNKMPKRLQVTSGITNFNCKKGKICFLNADSGTCPQDGGSPLLYNYEGRAVVVGINDRIDKLLRNKKKFKNDEYDKCKANTVTEFTPIGLYMNWIRQNFGEKCTAPYLIKHKKKLCKCKPIGRQTKSYRGFNGTVITNKNDLTYIAHLVKIKYQYIKKPPFEFGIKKIYKPFCSGSLINPRFILTVTHCILTFNLDVKILEIDKANNFDRIFKVGVSLHNLKDIYNNPNYMSTIQSVYFHPFYNGSSGENDIALVKTDKEFDFLKLNIYPPCLLDFDKYDYGNDVLIQAGFGADDYFRVRPYPKSLIDDMAIDAQVLDLKVTKNYQTECPNKQAKLICIRGYYQGPCIGDSGGPLIALNKEKNREQIIAVHSLGTSFRYNTTHIAHCIPKSIKYLVYLYPYIDWIKSYIGVNFCPASTDN